MRVSEPGIHDKLWSDWRILRSTKYATFADYPAGAQFQHAVAALEPQNGSADYHSPSLHVTEIQLPRYPSYGFGPRYS